ncbi:MAG: polyprenyl synthetase family protein [Planctomycetes bacterium]|nr:polyprenyl synthetase family protein [Planctomycetota bacterium]MCH9723915.1 polyprenyl synthetase family protein [Planctomycetota bacterium]MCH9778641.1 polyprenyl synthetase family protein [Planctomycetota bacterium]MCH9789393.1 polyprenyl synthetase family protein [Planctomycetota bacterium]
MSIAPLDQESSGNSPASGKTEEHSSAEKKPVKRKRQSTSHLKAVPDTLALREEMKAAAEKYVEQLDFSNPFTKTTLEKWSRDLLDQMNQPEKFLGFMMVLIGNFFWKRQFLAIPFERRLLLLPHCLKHAEGCPAEYDEFGLDCEKCGACSIADYKVKAEKLGYKVLVAEGSPVVLKIIIGGYVDGILGVACLNVLEKSIDKVLIAGVPSYAIPLHSGDCKNTKMDEPWIWEVLEEYQPLEEPLTRSYLPTMRAANALFEENFDQILPPLRTKTEAAAKTPLGKTETIAYDWLKHGGKRFRPFITLAAYDALVKDQSSTTEEKETGQAYPLGVQKAAMAIEVFHKASLIHDDIEDDDQYRYGRETLHRQHGTGMAINLGDYLIGIGYRLLNEARADIGAEAAADLVEKMAAAHIKLCEGQGAEMAWQESQSFELAPLDALQIYALKTSPAFEAALYAGIRMTGSTGQYEELISSFSRHIGVGFQILNDLKDWNGDDNNKLITGQDALAMRPTLLLALALQTADDQQKADLKDILQGNPSDGLRIGRLRKIYQDCEVFTKAETLVDKSRARAEALAESVENEDFKQLLKFFCESVLAEELPEAKPEPNVLMPLV